MNRYRDYDRFAEVYNRHWGGYAAAVIEPLDRLGLAQLQEGDHVIDLCCGTGQLAASLTARGLLVTGIDGSAEMIRLAQTNAPDATFVVADVRRFTLEGRAQMAVSTFDSLNHILDPDDLEQAFRCVSGSLVPGGRFIFDLNMDEGFRARWHGDSVVVDDDPELVIARSAYDADERFGSVDLILMRREGDAWRRTDLRLTQRAYTTEEVEGALRNAGFTDVESFDAPDIVEGWQSGRGFFVADRSG